ncbi:MAG: hypothetical protein QNJ41_05850 [Xenococcaceae cyanobacterium MO_188.B32]|nr:hypothetical protein [Xenococcaceae cyanobacterium MO_188.B32]
MVKEIGIENYELLSGYFDYYALLKARELNPNLPDRIRVFVVNKNNQNSVIKQLEAIDNLEKITRQSQDKKSIQKTENVELANLSAQIKDSDQLIIDHLNSLKAEILNDIDSKIPKPLPLLYAFNQISDDRVCELVLKKMSFLGKKKAKKIVDRLRDRKKKDKTEFKTFQNVLDALGKGYISKDKLLEVIDNWN